MKYLGELRNGDPESFLHLQLITKVCQGYWNGVGMKRDLLLITSAQFATSFALQLRIWTAYQNSRSRLTAMWYSLALASQLNCSWLISCKPAAVTFLTDGERSVF